jgi:hypothetical protein
MAETIPGWPAAMREDKAAAYIDVSQTWFRGNLAPHLTPLRPTPGVVLYLRADLDAWLDQQAGRAPASPPARSIIHDHIQATLRGKGRSAKAR